jgi:hypothetical protein
MEEIVEDTVEETAEIIEEPVDAEQIAEEQIAEPVNDNEQQATETMAAIFQRNAESHKMIVLDDVGAEFIKPRPISAGRQLTDQMKRDNWQLYVLARSNDPTVMVPNTRKLISNLVQSAKRMKNWTRNKDLVFAIQTSQEAWYEYSEEKNWGLAVQLCEMVVDRIGDLLYETEWAMGQSGSFAGPGTTGGKK